MAFFGLSNALLGFRGSGALYGDRAIATQPSKTESLKEIAPESSSETSAKSLSHKFHKWYFLTLVNSECLVGAI